MPSTVRQSSHWWDSRQANKRTHKSSPARESPQPALYRWPPGFPSRLPLPTIPIPVHRGCLRERETNQISESDRAALPLRALSRACKAFRHPKANASRGALHARAKALVHGDCGNVLRRAEPRHSSRSDRCRRNLPRAILDDSAEDATRCRREFARRMAQKSRSRCLLPKTLRAAFDCTRCLSPPRIPLRSSLPRRPSHKPLRQCGAAQHCQEELLAPAKAPWGNVHNIALTTLRPPPATTASLSETTSKRYSNLDGPNGRAFDGRRRRDHPSRQPLREAFRRESHQASGRARGRDNRDRTSRMLV